MDSPNSVAPIGESPEIDVLPAAQVAVNIAAEVVSTTVAGSAPFVSGIGAVLRKLQEAKSHQVCLYLF